MWNNFFKHIDIDPQNVHILDGNAADLAAECAAYEQKITEAGGVELFIGGIGADGHIAFNEPGSSLTSRTRVKTLCVDTREANKRFFGNDINKVPHEGFFVFILFGPQKNYLISPARSCGNLEFSNGKKLISGGIALTVGVGTVMDSKEVMVLITGSHKSFALYKAIEEGVNHMWTVSAFQQHPNTLMICDEDATLELRVKTVKYFKVTDCVRSTSMEHFTNIAIHSLPGTWYSILFEFALNPLRTYSLVQLTLTVIPGIFGSKLSITIYYRQRVRQ